MPFCPCIASREGVTLRSNGSDCLKYLSNRILNFIVLVHLLKYLVPDVCLSSGPVKRRVSAMRCCYCPIHAHSLAVHKREGGREGERRRRDASDKQALVGALA